MPGFRKPAIIVKRKNSEIDFLLIDVREDMEYNMGYIDGVNMLHPTSAFNEWAKELSPID